MWVLMLWWGCPYTNEVRTQTCPGRPREEGALGHRHAQGAHRRSGCQDADGHGDPREDGPSGCRQARGTHMRMGHQDADTDGAPTGGRAVRTQTRTGRPCNTGAQSPTSSRKVSGEGVSSGSDQVMRVGPHREISVQCPVGMRCHAPLSLCTRGQRPFPALCLLGVSPIPALATSA